MSLSIVMPVLDEAANIEAALQALAPLRARGVEVIVVDGGSRDGTADFARPLADRVIEAPRGRALQMNAGAASRAATCCCSCMPIRDCRTTPTGWCSTALRAPAAVWGRFDVRFDGGGLALVAVMMNGVRGSPASPPATRRCS